VKTVSFNTVEAILDTRTKHYCLFKDVVDQAGQNFRYFSSVPLVNCRENYLDTRTKKTIVSLINIEGVCGVFSVTKRSVLIFLWQVVSLKISYQSGCGVILLKHFESLLPLGANKLGCLSIESFISGLAN
jgi:hypothetical protein